MKRILILLVATTLIGAAAHAESNEMADCLTDVEVLKIKMELDFTPLTPYIVQPPRQTGRYAGFPASIAVTRSLKYSLGLM
jgi:hypothetical protein